MNRNSLRKKYFNGGNQSNILKSILHNCLLYEKELKFISLFSEVSIIIWWGGRAAMRSPAE